MALPKLVAFDLDYTLWPAWVDAHVEPPLVRKDRDVNRVHDITGTKLSFYGDVPALLLWIHHQDIHLAAASRTPVPVVARQALDNLYIPYSAPPAQSAANPGSVTRLITSKPYVPASKLFDTMELYPGSKIEHFQKIHKKSGVPYSEMIFFDDEMRNIEVEKKLGVTFIYVRDGMNRKIFDQGLETWRKR